MLASGVAAILPLMMPVILFAGILLGIATPTEVSSFAVVYGLMLSVVVYRELDLTAFLRAVLDAAMLAGMVLFILGAAWASPGRSRSRICRSAWSTSSTASTTTPRCSRSARSRS